MMYGYQPSAISCGVGCGQFTIAYSLFTFPPYYTAGFSYLCSPKNRI